MKGTRRSVYFKFKEFPLLEFIESQGESFGSVVKEMARHIQNEGKVVSQDDVSKLVQMFIKDLADIKWQLEELRKSGMTIQGNLVESLLENEATDERDFSGFDDL